MSRLSGHGLQREGRAHDADGHYTGAQSGRGLCQCGEMSPLLDTTRARQRWHVEYKTEKANRSESEDRHGRP